MYEEAKEQAESINNGIQKGFRGKNLHGKEGVSELVLQDNVVKVHKIDTIRKTECEEGPAPGPDG